MSKGRTSMRNPPSTGYRRPAKRAFHVWQDRFIAYGNPDGYGREKHPWRWCCTLCDPPSYGFRCKKGAWLKIMTVTMPRHFAVREHHHAHVARKAAHGE